MSEPTREQIKEAFKETIERWEKIVEDVGYWAKSECELCRLGPGTCSDYCPVKIYTKIGSCRGTPYWAFSSDRTPANALAELNFLRKVYIWWMEGEGKTKEWGKEDRPEEKKEEWVDVTDEIVWSVQDYDYPGTFPHLLYGEHLNKEEVVYVNESGFHIAPDFVEKYKTEQKGQTFSILKKI